MEESLKKQGLKSVLLKYRYPAIILLAGILLMLLPERKTQEQPIEIEETTTLSLEERLESTLSTIEGAGDVKVLLSVSAGENVVYQSDVETEYSSEEEVIQTKTILISDSQRAEKGLIQQINPPKYQGAVVICRGGDNPVVRLAIVDAVSTVTGLGADRISVMKMK